MKSGLKSGAEEKNKKLGKCGGVREKGIKKEENKG